MKSLSADKFPTAAVEIVAGERATDIGEMNADLVSSARFETDLQQRMTAVVHNRLVTGNGALTVGADASRDYAFAFAGDRSVDHAAFGNYSLRRGEIYLSAFFLQQISRIRIFRNQAQSRSILVETVYRAESELRIKIREQIRKGIAAVSCGRVNGHSRRLVEKNYIFIFEHDICLEIAVRLCFAGFVALQHNNVAVGNFIDGSDKSAVPRDSAVTVFQLLKQSARYAAFFAEIALQRDAFSRIYGKNQLCHCSEPPVRRERIRPL